MITLPTQHLVLRTERILHLIHTTPPSHNTRSTNLRHLLRRRFSRTASTIDPDTTSTRSARQWPRRTNTTCGHPLATASRATATGKCTPHAAGAMGKLGRSRPTHQQPARPYEKLHCSTQRREGLQLSFRTRSACPPPVLHTQQLHTRRIHISHQHGHWHGRTRSVDSAQHTHTHTYTHAASKARTPALRRCGGRWERPWSTVGATTGPPACAEGLL